MQISFSTRISIETARALDEYCQRTGKSKASVVDAALTEYLKNHPVEARKENQKK